MEHLVAVLETEWKNLKVEPERNGVALRKRPILVSPLGIFRRQY
jgi:hypothetical protein